MLNEQNVFFITGTDTGIGKTVVSAALMCAFKGTYWKPVQSGIEAGMTDTRRIRELTGLSESHFLPEAYLLKAPCSPHLSARLEGIEIDLGRIRMPVNIRHRPLIVEGAGGVLVPVNRSRYMLDLMVQLDLPVILAASGGLGTINHTLLSLYRMRAACLEVAGVVINGQADKENRKAIEEYGNVNVLHEIGSLPELSGSILAHIGSCIFKRLAA